VRRILRNGDNKYLVRYKNHFVPLSYLWKFLVGILGKSARGKVAYALYVVLECNLEVMHIMRTSVLKALRISFMSGRKAFRVGPDTSNNARELRRKSVELLNGTDDGSGMRPLCDEINN